MITQLQVQRLGDSKKYPYKYKKKVRHKEDSNGKSIQYTKEDNKQGREENSNSSEDCPESRRGALLNINGTDNVTADWLFRLHSIDSVIAPPVPMASKHRDRLEKDRDARSKIITRGKNNGKSNRGGAIDAQGERANSKKEASSSSGHSGGLRDNSVFECLKYLAPNITIEETDTGEVLIRRSNYGIMIQQEDLRKYIHEKLLTNEGNEVTLPFRALYRYTEEEYNSTAGLGLCSILAIVGILCPSLNSTKAMESVEGRNCIATSLEQIVIPAMEMYIQDPNYSENPNAHEHNVYKDVTVQHLTNFIELLRYTMEICVTSDQWMETSDVGTIIQSLPHAAVYWQEIGDNNWVALSLWSNVATNCVTQNINVLKELLMESTGHIVFGHKHFFNITALLPMRYSNLMVEIDYAIDVIKNQLHNIEDNLPDKNEFDVRPEHLDAGTVTLQKKNSQWFISISKDKMAKLSKLSPEQIRDKINKGNVFTIHKKIYSVNWSLIRGDGTCGYQSLHAVALHAANKSMEEISRSTKTSDKPNLLIKFLQDMVPRLQSQLLANSLNRVLKTIESLQCGRKIDMSQWCPTEIMEEILPTLHPNSRCWYHTRPPVRSAEWMSTYFSNSWILEDQGLDIVFNGIDHFTIHQNVEIECCEITEGIDNLIEVINKTYNIKGKWTVKHGMRSSSQHKSPDINIDDTYETEEGYTQVVKGKKSKRQWNNRNNSNQEKITDNAQKPLPVAPKVVKALYSVREVNARMKATINYAPKYHPLDDPLPKEEARDIPFPKKTRNDKTAWKYLLQAPSRIGKGLGVYTIKQIPADTIIMEYVDENAGKKVKDSSYKSSTRSGYVYVNEITSTRIDASSNKESYCGIVNEAFEDKHFNTIICERKINGISRVFFKTVREINAKEEIGTRYTNDGSYWRNSQHSEETMTKVDKCYNIVTPIREKSEIIGNTDSEERSSSPRRQLFRVQDMDEKINRIHDGFRQGTQEIDMDIQADWLRTINASTQKKAEDIWEDTDANQVLKKSMEECKVYDSDEDEYSEVVYHSSVKSELNIDGDQNIEDLIHKQEMEIDTQADNFHQGAGIYKVTVSDNNEDTQNKSEELWEEVRVDPTSSSEEYEVNGSDEDGYSNTKYRSNARTEGSTDGITDIFSKDQEIERSESQDDMDDSLGYHCKMEIVTQEPKQPDQHDNENAVKEKVKRKRPESALEQKDPRTKKKRSKNRPKKPSRENSSSPEQEEQQHRLERERLERLTKDEIIEYCLDQRCRHKKMLLKNLKSQNQGEDSKSGQYKKKANEVVNILLREHDKLKVPATAEVTCKIIKLHGLRNRKAVDYSDQLDTSTKVCKVANRTYKEPLKPRYTLEDPTVMNDRMFMIAQSGLRHKQHGVFSREEIPMKRNRKLFEYRSEHGYGTKDASTVSNYLSKSSDNKYMVNIGNIIVDAVHNTSSYCNYVQELLNHKNQFNCKYAKTGDTISIVQIAPIGKYEELNIQYSKDGEYWRNRKAGYPEAILKRARKFYHIEEPIMESKKYIEEIPEYISRPKNTDQEDFNLMDFENLFKWTSSDVDSNIRIGTLNINGALFDPKNGEPYFAYQLMAQGGINVLGLTDTRTPSDKQESISNSMRYPQPKGTAIICFPTKRLDKESNRLTTMGGQMIIVDRQWEPYISNKKSDASGLSLITSVSITHSKQTLVIIQVMVPPVSTGEYSMWERINEYLKEVGIRQNPREYVLDTASKWHINEKAKGNMVIVMGDFNRTFTQMHNWEVQNNLIRAHTQMEIAQVHPDRKLYTFLRNEKIHTHIDHIYYSSIDTIRIAEVGATDHPHIHEKTDHFPIWMGLQWKCKMKETKENVASTCIRNRPDLNLENIEENELYGIELDEYVDTLGEIGAGTTPKEAGRIQAAIYAKSAEIAAEHSAKPSYQATRPQGRMHRYKDCFSPDFRVLQESLHTYINLGRILDRLRKKKHSTISRVREINRLYPKWRRVFNRYYHEMHPDEHTDMHLFPSELIGISIQQSKQIDIATKIARIKARLHGRRRIALRAKLSERCRTMQAHMDINKLKKVIQMVIPTARSALDFAALTTENGDALKDDMVDREANKVMKTWMSVPGDIHPIAREFEDNPEKWKQLLYGTYSPIESNIPNDLLQQVMKACEQKELKPGVAKELHDAMQQTFTFEEFNKARLKLTKDKSPGPSGVTNNQMKSWNEKTARAVHELSNIMWRHHSVPQFWQDRLMTLLPKINGVNDLSKVRPISLFENIRKLWAGMVSRRVQSIWHKHNLLHPNQHGFRWQRGTHTAVLHLLNQLELADNAEPTYLTMWDIRRAFDSVPKWLQRLAWARLGMATDDLEWFLRLDATGNIYIRTPEFELNREMTKAEEHLKEQLPMLSSITENQFHPERGIGQGDTPSTLIFIAVFDILLTLLDNSGTGTPHAYADDLAHAAKTQEKQQQQADLVSVFCVVTSLEITTAKVEAIALNHSKFFTTTLVLRDWQWTPHLIVQSDKDFWTRYLGIYLDSEHCDRHYEIAIKQYRAACHALMCRTAPSSAKRMVHMMCLRPRIRYIASLAPWTLQQHQTIDKVPYQALCQIYGLRRGFPLALIYAPINVGGCGEIKFSDEVNSMKWKILHSNMHLGGISAEVSTSLIQRAQERRRSKMHPRGYVDSLLQWGCEMGLQLYQHTQTPMLHYVVRLRQMLANQDPAKKLRIYSNGGIGVDDATTPLQRLIAPTGKVRTEGGVSQVGIYIEGTLTNGMVSRHAIKIISKDKGTKLNTSIIHELLGIIIGMKATDRVCDRTVYSDSSSVVTRVNEVLREGSKALLHLPYGPILSAVGCMRAKKHNIKYIPPNKGRKKVDHWAEYRNGLTMAKLIAAKPMQEIISKLTNATIFYGSIEDAIDAIIPEGTWIWKNLEGVPNFEPLRATALKYSHISYLNRRDTLRNKMDMQQPARWSRYNMQFATLIADTRERCSARIRGHNCKQMYDWTTHAVNLAKGIVDEPERVNASKCILCKLDKEESQIHTSTTCQHVDLVYIRKIYRKDIDKILEAVKHMQTPREEEWIQIIVKYMSKNIWGETQLASDLWNGRWTQHMWQEALAGTGVELKNNDIQNGRIWMTRLTSKLFEAQSALSRHRFKLIKRTGNPLFERPGRIPRDIKKRLLEEHESTEFNKRTKRRKLTKCRKIDGNDLKEVVSIQLQAKKRKVKDDTGKTQPSRRAGTDLSQSIVSKGKATTGTMDLSSAALSQGHSKRERSEWLPAQPNKKRTVNRGTITQHIGSSKVATKRWNPTEN